MALTLNGNRTGLAGVTDKRDSKEYILEMQLKNIREQLRAQETAGILRCIELEGEDKFFAWWDDDNNVPPIGTIQDRICRLQNHIAELEEGTHYTPVINLNEAAHG